MTLVNVVLTTPQLAGINMGPGSWLYWAPAQPRNYWRALTLPAPFTMNLTTTPQALDAPATGTGWCWEVDYHEPGREDLVEYVLVPATGPVNFMDLVRVNPATLYPLPPAPPLWFSTDATVPVVGALTFLDGGNAASTYPGTYNFQGGGA